MSEKKIGFEACINAIGRECYIKNKHRCVFASGNEEGKGLWCFIGLNTTDTVYEGLRLDADFDDWEYYASCFVKDGTVNMDKCRLP